MEVHGGADLLAGLVTPWGCWSSLFLKDCTLWEGTHAGAVCEELQPVGRTHDREVCAELSPVRGTFTLEQGQSVRSPPPEEEGAAETTCDELTAAPCPHSPSSCDAQGGR